VSAAGPFRTAFVLLATVVVVVLGAGQLGLLAGTPPTDLGVHDGRLKAPSTTSNSVSSQASLWDGHPMQLMAQIAPLPLPKNKSPAEALLRVRLVVQSMPGAEVVTHNADYLYVRFTTRWLGFVDDAEFWADPAHRVIQVRSASRLGASDLGVNRARIERIRAALATPAAPR
jgi:uncharacterized protein (DUF1499 family)